MLYHQVVLTKAHPLAHPDIQTGGGKVTRFTTCHDGRRVCRKTRRGSRHSIGSEPPEVVLQLWMGVLSAISARPRDDDMTNGVSMSRDMLL